MNFRYDKRSETQFAKDIKEATRIERKLMESYIDWLNRKKDASYAFIDNGIDNSGAFIASSKKVTCDADFLLTHAGKRDKKIDIKFCREEKDKFHLKQYQVNRYVENDVCVVNFMGIETKNSRFCILPPKELMFWLENAEKVLMWNKLSLRIPTDSERLKWYKVKL